MLAGNYNRTFSVYDFPVARFSSFAGPGVRSVPMSIADEHYYDSDIYIEVNNQDRTSFVEWRTLEVANILTRQVDTASFSFNYKNGDEFSIAVNDNVKIYDSGYMIFQGIVTNVRKKHVSGQMLSVFIQCADFTRELDNKVVAQTYTALTAQQIIQDIILRYAPQFDTRYVYAPVTINKIQFTYQPVSKCLEELADMIGYDFYVDEHKFLHFNQAATIPAPFQLMDDNGTYVRGSLTFEDDIAQLRNSVYLRGGNEVGLSTPYQANGDGNQKTFTLGYHYSAIPTVTVGGVSKTIGTNNVDATASYDCMWDPTGDFVVFATAPGAGVSVVITGTPLYPILLTYPERGSVALYGERQIVIIDKTITSRSGARQRALAELVRYSEALVSATFLTRTRGLKAGQVLTVDSDLFGKSDDYVITEVRTKPWTPTTMEYEVTLVSTKLVEIVDLLGKMLREKLKTQDYSSNESFDPVEVVFEDVTATDAVTVSVGGSVTTAETVTPSDAVTVQALDFGITFVFGPFIPIGGDNRRVFVCDLSYLN